MPTPNLGLTQPPINPTYDLWGAAMNNNLSLIDAASITLRGTPVAATAPTLNQVLKFNGTSWAPGVDAGGVTGSGTTGKLSKWVGGTALGDSILSDDGVTLLVSGNVNAQSYLVSGTPLASTHLSDSASLLRTSTALGGDLSGTHGAATVAKINGVTLGGTPSSGRVLIASSGSAAAWAAAPWFKQASTVVTVAAVGGDFATVGAAVASLGTPSSPVAILIAPGTYTETIFTLPGNILLIGSTRGSVVLNFSSSSPAITITGAGCAIQFLSIVNSAGPGVEVNTPNINAPNLVFATITGTIGIRLVADTNNAGGLALFDCNLTGTAGAAYLATTPSNVTMVDCQVTGANGFDAVVFAGNSVNGRSQNIQNLRLSPGSSANALSATAPTSLFSSLITAQSANPFNIGANISFGNSCLIAGVRFPSNPSSGQALVATAPNTAVWQTPFSGGGSDLTGTLVNPSVNKLQGTPLFISGAVPGNLLRFDGANWAASFSASYELIDGNTLIRSDGLTAMNADLNLNTFKIVSLGSPTSDFDAANKVYVDGVAQGLDVKKSVRATTMANITLSGPQTIDGVALLAGDRVLVKDQTAAQNNGIYDVQAGAWTRSADADNSPVGEVTSGMFTFVEEGTIGAGNGYVLTTANPITLGTTPLAFSQFSGAGQIIAGQGLSKSGNTLSALDASNVVKGVVTLSLAPVSPTAPIAVGDNDPRVANVAHGSGTSGKLSKWTAGTVLGDSIVSDNGTNAKVNGGLGVGRDVGFATDAPYAIEASGTILSVSDGLGNGGFFKAAGFGSLPGLGGLFANGTELAPTAVLSGDNLFFIGAKGYDGTNFSLTGSRVAIQMFATENWTPAAQGTMIRFRVTQNGTNSNLNAMWIDNTGFVGFGVATPNEKVQVVGNVNISGVYKVGGVQIASSNLSDGGTLIKTTTTLGGDLSGNLPNATVAKVNGVAVTGTPTVGQTIVATSGSAATWQTPASASALKTTGADVVVSAAAPPTTGQVLTATSATTATWQTPSGGSGGGYATVVVAAPTGVAATDTSNIQTAINSISLGTVILREGLYLVNATLTIKSRITIKGQGKGEFGAGAATTIKCDNAFPDAALIDDSASTKTDFCLEDLSIDFNGFSRPARSGSIDLRLNGTRARLRRVAMANTSGTNIPVQVNANNSTELDSPLCEDCVFVQGKVVANQPFSLSGRVTNCTFIGNTATAGFQSGLVTFNTKTTVTGCVFRTNVDYTTGVTGATVNLTGTGPISIVGCVFIQESGTATRALQINDGTTGPIAVVGCTANSTSAGTMSVRTNPGNTSFAGNVGFGSYTGAGASVGNV